MSDAANIKFIWGQAVPLRDGVKLHATVYLPKDQGAPAPCVFTLTPYVADTYHAFAVYFAAHGIPFVIVDARGRGNSEGVFKPNVNEARDGSDVVTWLSQQLFCNGKVGMWGGSYAGCNQWMTAREFPPQLAAIAPAASPTHGVDFPMRNNIFLSDAMHWLLLVSGRASQWQTYGDTAWWAALGRQWLESGAPFNTLDRLSGQASAQ